MKNIKLMHDETLTMLQGSKTLLKRSNNLLKLLNEFKSDLTDKLKEVIQ